MHRPFLVAAGLLALAACSDGESTSPSSSTTTSTESSSKTASAASATVLAVGDIGTCESDDDEAVAELVETLAGSVLLLGDIVYPSGTTDQFANCFDPAWGQFRSRFRPVPGNHEYKTAAAAGYFGYFGHGAGEPNKGWHSFDAGPWHVVALNSNCAAVGGCAAGSEQERWLRADLARSTARCTLAYWHHARFSSGSVHGSDPVTGDLWRALADSQAEVVVTAHEHHYERFAPLDPGGRVDPARGIRSFVVGTGGRSHYEFGEPREGSEVRNASTFGLLELTLSAEGYRWRFVPVGGEGFTDEGEGRCR